MAEVKNTLATRKISISENTDLKEVSGSELKKMTRFVALLS
jgi:hypothetical protein